MEDWVIREYDGIEHLERQYVFKKYSKALAFLNAVAGLAESCVHHPRMVLEWGRLTIAWGTHESNEGSGVLALDRAMARQCDLLFEAVFEAGQKKPV